jgi:hypothetical protein
MISLNIATILQRSGFFPSASIHGDRYGQCGATRIGTTNSVQMAKEFIKKMESRCDKIESMQGIRDDTGKWLPFD